MSAEHKMLRFDAFRASQAVRRGSLTTVPATSMNVLFGRAKTATDTWPFRAKGVLPMIDGVPNNQHSLDRCCPPT